ncbi:MAG: MCE family protein, partial [Deltaproteobacteria bacterium]|nr:MCE family protein [Deltaproteobacteria bacterium]
MRKQWEMETKVGIFIILGTCLIMLAVVLLGGVDSFFTSQNKYYIHYPSIEGLVTGSKVVLGGLRVGLIDKVDFDTNKKDIKIDILIEKKYADWIRKDSVAEILTQGVLGDKYISIKPGTQEVPVLPALSEITTQATLGLSQFFSKGDQLLIS